jgi:hypothetical protein
MNSISSTTVRAARRIGTLLAISATAVGISAAAASATPLTGSRPGSPAPIAKGTLVTDYATLGAWASGNGGSGGQPAFGFSAGANAIDPLYATPVVTVLAPAQDLTAFPGGAMLGTSSANIDVNYQLRMDCADGFHFQGPTQVFTGVGVGSTAKSTVPAGVKALEWPTVADRHALNSGFAKHYAGSGCTIQPAALPSSRTLTTNVGVNAVGPSDNDPIDAGYINQQGYFTVATVTSSGPAGGL